jgi:hypothetical protein
MLQTGLELQDSSDPLARAMVTPVIPATWEVEIRRIKDRGQLRHKVSET